MRTKKVKKPLKINSNEKEENIQKAVQNLAVDFQKNHLDFYYTALRYCMLEKHEFMEFIRKAPYCLASIGYGMGFQKSNPIENMGAFELSVILNPLGFEPIQITENSAGLDVFEGVVTFRWVKKEKIMKFKLHCECKTDVEILDYVYQLRCRSPFYYL